MKEKIKRILSEIVYFFYQHGIIKNRIQYMTIEETIDELANSEKSLIRFGDGEIKLISGKRLALQNADSLLTKRLIDLLKADNPECLVAITDVFTDVSGYLPFSQHFWKEHMLFHRKEYIKYCRTDYRYGNAFISRPYIMYNDENRRKALGYFQKMKTIWEDREIVVVEGAVSHNGVENDFFSNAKKVERLICPSKDAWKSYDEILKTCLGFAKEKLILISLGAVAKPLAYDLCKEGFRALDIGSADMEYDWCRQKVAAKCRVPKHEVETYEDNLKAGYTDYLNEIIGRIE